MACYMCKPDKPCARCVRLGAIGAIVTGLAWETHEERWDALEGLAELLIDRGRLVRQHNRDMADEQRYAYRSAAQSYDEGKFDGFREGQREEQW